MADTVMDMVNAALGDAGTAEPIETEEVETPEGEESVPGEGEVAEGTELADEAEGAEGEEKPDGEIEEGEEKPDEDKANKGRERNPDGTFKEKIKEVAKDGEQKPEVKGEKKTPDAVNDPIPNGLKKETQERMRTLITTTKEVTADRDKIKQDLEFIVQGVEKTGATPQQYGEALTFLSLFNSGDVTQQAKALDILESAADRLATQLGKERTVSDPLKTHADLQEAVTKGQITREYAKQLATARNANTFRTEVQTHHNAQQTAQQQHEQALETARSELNSLEQTLRGIDKQYDAKREIIVPILKPIFASLPPSQWKQAFENAYKNAKVQAPAAKPVVGSRVPANQPLRAGKNPAGSKVKVPTTGLEAMDAALASMR